MNAIFRILLVASAAWISFGMSGCKEQSDTWKKTEIIDMDQIVETDGNSGLRFDILTGKSTGIDFNNVINSTHKVNVYYNSYAYNGAGMGIADLNNDGLQDVYMAGNWVDDRIYLNKGDLKFEDVSASSGIQAYPGYSTGVSMVDINNDGWMDIYVCRDWFKETGKKNDLLFINNGDMTFTESAADYGLVFDAFSTQANFFDYDNDGDLDLYVVTHPDDWNDKSKLKYFVKIENGQNQSDYFFRNDGGKFTDISKEAGINNHGYGLSATVGDINNDGYLDIYVANDFVMYDFLYMNNGDGTFTDETKKELNRNSHFAMGADVVDVNNDGLLDIYTVDMDLEDNYTIKTFTFVTRKEQFESMEKGGYHSQYVGNVLQLNNGNDHFTEIARMAGVSTTGWSWSPLFADYDNDGDRDLFVTNGNGRDFHVDNTVGYHRLRRATRIGDSLMYKDLLDKYPTQPLVTPNAIFENNGDLSFTDQRHGWGIYFPSASYGGGFADFDNDGDIDILVNNINESAFLYRNNSEKLDKDRNWLNIELKGPPSNVQGFGTRVEVHVGDKLIYTQHSTIRGYMTTVENRLHFGLGESKRADKVVITWLDGQRQILENVNGNQQITVDYANANLKVDTKDLHPYGSAAPTFTKVTEELGINYVHKENKYDDFQREYLLPHKLSYLGPGIAVADVNGDGLMDVFVGAAQGSTGKLMLQNSSGKFSNADIKMQEHQTSEDMGLLFFDADGDGDQDLYVGSGGSDFQAGSGLLQDRVYFNDGKGNFSYSRDALPEMLTSTSCIAASDFDQDGDLDLFVGSRVMPGHYPMPERAYLLKNDGGKFSDVTKQWSPELERPGLITDARWSDYNNDGKTDLLLVGEWTSLEVYKNTGSKLEHLTSTGVEDETGWYNSLSAGDFDHDGDIDYIAGNFGINCKYKPSEEGPIVVYADDFDDNGTNDIIMGFYQNGVCYPIKSRERMMEQCPGLYDLIPTWDAYGKTTITDLFGQERMDNAKVHLNAKTFKTIYFENLGGDKFEARAMNNELQISSVFGMLVADFNRDGNLDLLSHGNNYYPETETNRQDASVGQLLLGKGDGTFRAVRAQESGFFSELDAKALAWLRIGKGNEVAVLGSNNNGPLNAYKLMDKSSLPALFPAPGDQYALVEGRDGSTTKIEFYLGSGYLSSSSQPVFVTSNARKVKFFNAAGEERTVFPVLRAQR